MAHVIPVVSKGSVLKILIGVIIPQPLPEMTPRIFIFSIVIADYSFYVKSISTCALTFFGYIISVLTSSVIQVRMDQGLVVKIRCPMRSL